MDAHCRGRRVLGAFPTTASMGFDVLGNIFFAIVVRELFPSLDRSNRVNENTATFYLGLAVRLTRMIDIACEVLTVCTVNGLATIYFKEIFTLAGVLLCFRNDSTKILDDTLSPLKRTSRKETEPCARPPHSQTIRAYRFSL